MPLLSARKLQKHYGHRAAVDGIDLEVGAGESLILLGPNGAGKTTLLHLIAGVLKPDAGVLELAGLSPHDPAARRAIGLVPQALAIYPQLSVRENLDFFARVLGVVSAARKQRVAFGLALSGLADRAEDRAGTLSGGMQRRLNLACAVLHRPALLLLDEPTAGVDPQSRQHLYTAIEALQREGVTLVCSTHLSDEADRLGARVVIMHHGRVRADDTKAALLARHGTRDLLETVVRLTPSEGAV